MPRTLVSTIQWFLFIICTNIAPPLAIAASFELSGAETLSFLSRCLFVFAILSLFQVLLGHRLPIMEGPAGIWWGVFALYSSIGVTLYGSYSNTLQSLGFLLLLSGIICIVLTMTGVLRRLVPLFTPQVIGVYMLLLSAQLSGSVMKGLLNIEDGRIQVLPAVISILTVLISLYLERSDRLRQYALLITLLVGWSMFALIGRAEMPNFDGPLFTLPSLLPFGGIHVDWSLLPTALIISLLLMTNVLANIKVIERIISAKRGEPVKGQVGTAGITAGIGQLFAGLFGTVGPVAISGTAGFIASTDNTDRKAFVYANITCLFLSIVTPFVGLIAKIPVAVGYAMVAPIVAGMAIIGVTEAARDLNRQTAMITVGLPVLVGIGALLLPKGVTADLPPLVTTLMSNGLVLGTLVALLAEGLRHIRTND
ncbi:purine/pyrimidine permease [uncultured Exiguobacterium sp.]|uniref:purine/pyrimidine permease n=1 Tax=uncultured Exiguobacterium sp. TaxID=202669 RepID=UPI0025DAD946|nr:purine/pyrimidine permease [uncultured Exiguobacterium sp.]